MQLATLSFADALAAFRSQARPVSVEAVQRVETALRTDLPIEYRPPAGAGYMRTTAEFLDWADSRRAALDVGDILAAFGVSRATAYRWLSAWRDLRGLSA